MIKEGKYSPILPQSEEAGVRHRVAGHTDDEASDEDEEVWHASDDERTRDVGDGGPDFHRPKR